jgi:hypothetical protein
VSPADGVTSSPVNRLPVIASVAKQSRSRGRFLDCFVAYALRYDGGLSLFLVSRVGHLGFGGQGRADLRRQLLAGFLQLFRFPRDRDEMAGIEMD